MQEGHGACMQDNHCKFEACAGDGLVNLPAYSVAAATVADVQAALAFASTHDLSVSVKTSGHSYAGSSAMKGSLLIWMAEFEKFGTIATHTDSCGTATEQVLKVGGGQVWGEAYPVVGDAGRDIVGGGGLTVAAAGGWLMGGGLSALSRTFGYGIDNVVAFEVVAADGVLRTADACSEPDLFWALRGGGGGAFGVVTAAYHRTHASSAVAALSMSIDITGANWESRAPVIESWLDFWVETSPTLGREWSGGYWTLSSIVVLYFRGTASEAEATFVGALREWRARLTAEQQQYVTISLTEFDSYWASRTAGCRDSSSVACRTFGAETDATGQAGVNIHSRMIPAAWVTQNNGAEAKATLKWMMYNGWFTFNYFLGGAVTDVAADETAVHPSVRVSIWNMEVFDPRLIERLRDDLPDSGALEIPQANACPATPHEIPQVKGRPPSCPNARAARPPAGVCYNHAAKDEPDWDAQAWGANLPRLLQVKAAYDPANRLNCFHCVGYQSLGGDDLTPATCEGMYNCATGPGDEPAPQPPGTQPLPPASPQPPSLPVGAATYFYSSADCTGTPTVLAIGHGECVGDEWGYFYTISCAAGASNLSWFSNADCSGDADGTLGSNEDDGMYGGWLLGKADGSSGPIRPGDCWTWATSATGWGTSTPMTARSALGPSLRLWDPDILVWAVFG